MTQVIANVILEPASAVHLLRQSSLVSDTVQLLFDDDSRAEAHVTLNLYVEGDETLSRVELKPDGTWSLRTVLVVGEMP